MTAEPVLAFARRHGNAGLIADVVRLRYLKPTDKVLDPTWGLGTWWKEWHPAELVGSDIDPELSPGGISIDFTNMPCDDESFDVVAYDPPYKLNGTPSEADIRYGCHVIKSWQDRHALITEGITECARVLKVRGYMLLKCQDQVCSGAIRWQTIEFTNHAATVGLDLVDSLHLVGARAQPERTRKDGEPSVQQHARRNASTLLILRKRKVGQR